MGGSTLSSSFEFCLSGTCRVFCSRADKVRLLTTEKLVEMLSKWIHESPTNVLLFQFQYILLATEMQIACDYEKVSLSYFLNGNCAYLVFATVLVFGLRKFLPLSLLRMKSDFQSLNTHLCTEFENAENWKHILKFKAQKHSLIKIVSSATVLIRACLFQFSGLMIEEQMGKFLWHWLQNIFRF